jgi:hypothetical protein
MQAMEESWQLNSHADNTTLKQKNEVGIMDVSFHPRAHSSAPPWIRNPIILIPGRTAVRPPGSAIPSFPSPGAQQCAPLDLQSHHSHPRAHSSAPPWICNLIIPIPGRTAVRPPGSAISSPGAQQCASPGSAISSFPSPGSMRLPVQYTHIISCPRSFPCQPRSATT